MQTNYEAEQLSMFDQDLRRVAAVRVPDRCEVGRAVIGAVGVIFESEGGTLSTDAAVQQSPESFVPEFREISHRILRRRDSRALRCRYRLLRLRWSLLCHDGHGSGAL